MTAKNNGFTLIEILIAMSLLSVMVILLFGSLRMAAQSWEVGEAKIMDVNQKAVVFQFFKRHLNTIRPVDMLLDLENPDAMTQQQQVFKGHPQALRFAASLTASSTRKGLQIFEIGLDPQQSSTLLVSLTPYQQIKPDPVEPVVLLKNIERFNLQYFGKTEAVAEPVWQDEWLLFDRLPNLIKVSILLKDHSYWPDMIFALKINHVATAETVDQADSRLGNADNQ